MLLGYRGAAIDPLVFRIVIKHGKASISIQFFQTKNPRDEQNKLVIKLLQNISDELDKISDKDFIHNTVKSKATLTG